MDPQLLEILRKANRALAAGEDRKAIDAAVRRRTQALGQELGFDDLVAVARTSREQPEVRPITTPDLLRSGAQGATFGFLDELVGAMAAVGPTGAPPAMGAPPPSVAAQEAMGGVREAGAQFREEHPTADLLAQLYGGLVPAIATGKMLPTPVPQEAGEIARLLAATGTGAGVGAAAGALQGAGEAPTLEEVPGAMLRGGAVGGVAGAGISAALGLVTSAGRIGQARFFPAAAGRAAARRSLQRAVENTGESLRTLAKKFSVYTSRRPNVVPADLDPQFGRLLREVTNEGSGNIGPLIRRLRERVLGAGERLAADLEELSGFGQRTADEARDAARARLDALGDDIFEQFRQKYLALRDQPEWGRYQNLFKEITEDPNVAPVWRKVRPRLTQDEPIGFGHLYALRRAMGDEANAMKVGGRSEGARQMGRLREQLTDILDNVVPGFRAANRQYAQTARTVEAFDLGADAFKKGYSAQQVVREQQELVRRAGDEGGRALEAYRHGLVDQLLRQVRGYRRGVNVGAREFKGLGPRKTETLRAAFPDQNAFKEMLLRADIEDAMAELRNLVLANSTTGQQMNDLARSARTAGFWSTLTAALNYLSKPNERIPVERANALIKALATEGPGGMRALETLARQRAPGAAGAAMAAGQFVLRPDVTSSLVGPRALRLLDLLDRPEQPVERLLSSYR